MAIISPSLFSEARGSLKNVVFYTVKGQLRIRTKPLQHRDRKSPGQLAQRQKLKGALYLYRMLDFIFLYSWKQRTQHLTMTFCNLFIKENIHNVTSEGELADPVQLKICTGNLSLPVHWDMKTEGREVVLCWQEGDSEKPRHQDEDLLQIGVYGYINALEDSGIYYLKEVRTSREMKTCRFSLPDGRGMFHIYACFKNPYTNEYSDSVWLGCCDR